MRNVAEILEALGGERRVADSLGVPAGTVSSWKSRGAIPARAWTNLVEYARKRRIKGVTFETLASIHSKSNPAAEARRGDGSNKIRRRTRVRIRIDRDLLAEATALGVEIDSMADQVLCEAIKHEKNRRWQAEHADVIAWYNEHIERDGIFGEEWRAF